MVGIDLVPVPIVDPAPELDGLDLDAIAASTGRVEVQPLYEDGFIEDASLPVAPDGLGYFGVLGFVDGPRDALEHGHDEMDVEPADFAWDAIVGPLRREEDGHTRLPRNRNPPARRRFRIRRFGRRHHGAQPWTLNVSREPA